MGRTRKEYAKTCIWNLPEMEIVCQCLLLKEYCKKSFSLMDSFWVEIGSKSFNINGLVKVRGHLDKVEKDNK